VEGILPAGLALNQNLPASDRAPTQDAHALIVEGMPSTARVIGLEDPQSLFWKEMKIHI
jgi:hypothetical protein